MPDNRLSFSPFTGLQPIGPTSVPTTANDYYALPPIPQLQVNWNPKERAKAEQALSVLPEIAAGEWNVMKPIERWQGGLDALDDDERALWEQENATKLEGRDDAWKDRLWRNQEYVKVFGMDDFFQTPDKNTRDQKYFDYITGSAIKDRFGKERNLGQLLNLTPEGRVELLNSDYKSDLELQLQKSEEKEKTEKSWGDYTLGERATSVWNNTTSLAKQGLFEGSILGTAFGGIGIIPGMALGALSGATAGLAAGILHPEDSEDIKESKTQAKNDEILHKITVADNERKKTDFQDAITELALNYYSAYRQGQITDEDINAAWDQLALNGKRTTTDELGNTETYDYTGSNYYSAFKDTDEFEKFGPYDKMRQLAQAQVLGAKYGKGSALQVLDQDMQSWVNKEQSGWEWLGHSLQNVVVGGVANLANNITALGALNARLLYGEEGLANYLKGKDASGDGEDNWFNPMYWNKVDQYNTFSPDAIAKADTNGGISRWNNIVAPGTEEDFRSWNTANEALRMSKFAWSDLLKNLALGKLIGAATRLTGGIEMAPGVLASESTMLSRGINKVGSYGVMAASSLGIDAAYGMQTYEEVLRRNQERLNQIIEKDVEEEVKRRIESPQAEAEFKAAINAENERRRKRAGERGQYIPVDETEAWGAYIDHLRMEVTKEVEAAHTEDAQQAENDAANAYAWDASIEAIRMAPANMLFKSYLFDKGTINALRMNNPYVKTTTTKDGMYSLGKHAIRKKAVGTIANQLWGGFQTNYFDDVTVGFAEGFGIQDYNNYLLQKYNPAAYGSILDEYVSPFAAGLAGAEDAMVSKRSFIDGGVGLLGTPLSIAPNIVGMASHADRMKQYAEELERDEKAGVKTKGLHWTEVGSDFINNPILQAIADAKAASRLTEREIKRANDAIKENGYAFDNMVETISSLNQKAGAREGTSLMEAEDAKDKEAFTLATALLSLRDNGAVVNAEVEPNKAQWSRKKKAANMIGNGLNALLGLPLFESAESSYTRAIQSLEDAAAMDESSDEEQVARQNELVKTFLGLSGNQNAVEGMSQDEKNAFAKERLKKNAQGLLDIMEQTSKIQEKFAKSMGAQLHPEVAKQVMYQYVLDGRFKARLSNLEADITGEPVEEGTVPQRNSNPVAKYGSKAGWERSHKAQEKRYGDAKEAYEKLKEKAKTFDKIGDSSKSVLENSFLKASLHSMEREAKRKMDKEKTALEQIVADKDTMEGDATVINAQDILRLPADERLRVLDDYYRSDYSDAQKAEIDKAKGLLMQDGTPINEAMEKVRDAAILTNRIADNMESARTIMQNPYEANLMQQALSENRRKAIIDYFNDKVVNEAAQSFFQDTEATLSDEKATAKARNYSTAVLRGLYNEVQKILRRGDEVLPQMSLQNMADGIAAVLDERKAAMKNTVELDKFLKKTRSVNHEEVIEATDGSAVVDGATGEVVAAPAQMITTQRDLSENDRRLLDDVMDYLAERGLTLNDMEAQVATEDFWKYVDERNHITDVENRANPVSPEYMQGLVSDVLKAFEGTKAKTSEATAPKATGKAESVATKPVDTKGSKATENTREEEVRPGEKKATDDPFGARKGKPSGKPEGNARGEGERPSGEPSGTVIRNQEVVDNAVVLNEHLADEVASLLEAIDGMQMPEQTKEKMKDIIEGHLMSTRYQTIQALQNKLIEDALMTNQAEAPQIDVMASQLANLELKKAAIAEEKKGGNESNNTLSPNDPTPITTLETRDLDVLMNYPAWKEYITTHNVVGFLQKFSDALAKEWEAWKGNKKQGPLHQGQFVFLYDPALAERVKDEIEASGGNYVAEISAPVVLALEITDKNKHLVDNEGQLIVIKDKTDNKEHQYQMVGAMPASQVSREKESAAMVNTADRMSAIRNRINWNDTEAHVLRYAPKKNTGKYNGSLIQMGVDQARVSSHTEEDVIPHATAETPKTGVRQLMDENMTSPTESLVQATEEEKQAYQEAKEKGSLFGLRNNPLYKKMRKAFLDRLVKREREAKDADDPNTKELNFRLQKGTNDTYLKIVLQKGMAETLDRNTGEPIINLLQGVDDSGTNAQEVIDSNSRFHRLYNQLSKLKLPIGLFNADGTPANRITYQKTLIDFAKSVEETITNNLMVGRMGDLSVRVDISEGIPAEKTVIIQAYYGSPTEENLLSTLTTRYNGELSPAEYAAFLKDLILDKEGNVRKSKDDSRFDAVKFQVNYEDVNTMNDASKSKEARNIARTNLEEIYDDGVWEMQVTKLAYPSRSVEVSINKKMQGELYTTHESAPKVQAPQPTETHPVGETETKTGVLVDGDTGMVMSTTTAEAVMNGVPKLIMDTVHKMLTDSKTRVLDATGRFYEIGGQMWSRVTSIKYAMDGMGERFNPSNAWTLPSSLLGNSFDEFGRDVFNGVFDQMTAEERKNAFEGYDNSTEKNYSESYEALKAFQARLLQKGQVVIATGTKEDPGHITAKGLLNVTTKSDNGVQREQVRVAGTLDVLAIDSNGKLHIYDFKTHSANNTLDAAKATEKGYDRQLSMYAQFLEDEYGLKVESVNIIPISVTYPRPSGMDNEGHAIQGAQKTYRQERPGSNQLQVKDITADDSSFEEFKGADFKVEKEFALDRLSGEQLTASFEKMTAEEKEAIVEAIQDQSETPAAKEDLKAEDVITTRPEVENTVEEEEEEEGGRPRGSKLGRRSKAAVDTSAEAIAETIAPDDAEGFLARMRELRNSCGGKRS